MTTWASDSDETKTKERRRPVPISDNDLIPITSIAYEPIEQWYRAGENDDAHLEMRLKRIDKAGVNVSETSSTPWLPSDVCPSDVAESIASKVSATDARAPPSRVGSEAAAIGGGG